MIVFEMENWQNKCRVCLRKEKPGRLLPLFDETSRNVERVFIISGIQFDDYKEIWPDKICLKCSNALKTAIQIREMCIESDKHLRDQLRSKIFKQNAEDEILKEEIAIEEEFLFDEIYTKEETEITNTILEVTEQNEFAEINETEKTKCKMCEICGKSFTKNYISHHRRTHQVENINQFSCDLCGLSFKLKCYVYSHMKNVHSSVKKWNCKICGKGYAKKDTWVCHMRVHSENGRIFKCSFESCSKSFAKRNQLTVHMRIHTNVRPYTCGYCGRRFIHFSDHKRHVMGHTGDRPHKCSFPYCQKGFVKRSDLSSHEETHRRNLNDCH